MLKIIINAYAMCPGMGSEQGMAWNWCSNLAKHCELYIITESEYKDKILSVVKKFPYGENMHFFWNEVSPAVRNMCWNQGDWRFYYYYRKWQLKTAEIARGIVENLRSEQGSTGGVILHQLNMIGFREPGYLWKVAEEYDIPFVWGPIGGLKLFPLQYTDGGGLRMKLFNLIKNTITLYQIKYNSRISKALKFSDAIISSIPESYNAIKKYHGLESYIIPETGCFIDSDINLVNARQERFHGDKLNVLWVGKFDFRKRLDIAIRAIALSGENIQLKIFGSGSDSQVVAAKKLVDKLNLSRHVSFMGNRSNEEIKEIMSVSDLFLFTSVNEDTSTVVLEAVSCHLPVLCFDTCGMASVIDETVGRKVPLTNPKQSVIDFAGHLKYFAEHRDELRKMSEACIERAKELSWENKISKLLSIYEKL